MPAPPAPRTRPFVTPTLPQLKLSCGTDDSFRDVVIRPTGVFQSEQRVRRSVRHPIQQLRVEWIEGSVTNAVGDDSQVHKVAGVGARSRVVMHGRSQAASDRVLLFRAGESTGSSAPAYVC